METRNIVLALALLATSSVKADEFQALLPVAAYSSGQQTYIVFAENVGTHGCTIDRNSVVITEAEHGFDLVKSSLSIALTSIATGTSMKVFWSGCMLNGRPKATLIGLGTTEMN